MAIDPEKQVVGVVYVSDDGNSYTIGMRRNHAEAAGAVIDSSNPGYPRGWKPRHIGMIGDDGIQKTTMVATAPNDAGFVQEAFTLNIPGLGNFSKTGSVGEKRPHKYRTV